MNIVYSGTRNLYPCMNGAIASLLEHNPEAKVYVLAEDDTLPFEFHGTVINVSGQQYFPPDGPNRDNHFTYMAMLRVCTPELIPEDRVIQLDVDTIVCDSLEEIWNTDLDGKWVCWCPEHLGIYHPYGPKYYNFGVAVMNLKQMRGDHFTERAVEMLNTKRYPYIDQDIMNILAVPDKTVDLPVRYNESFCCGKTDNPAIVHYAGFHDWYTNDDVPRAFYRDLYKE